MGLPALIDYCPQTQLVDISIIVLQNLFHRIGLSCAGCLDNGQKWWDYTGFFLNLHGRICAEGLLAFGIGGMAIVYFVAPLLDNYFRKIKLQIIIPLCVALMMIFVADQLYTKKHPNVGEGITCLNIYDMYYYL